MFFRSFRQGTVDTVAAGCRLRPGMLLLLALWSGGVCAACVQHDREPGDRHSFQVPMTPGADWSAGTESGRLTEDGDKPPAAALLRSNPAGLLSLLLEQSQNRSSLRKTQDMALLFAPGLPVGPGELIRAGGQSLHFSFREVCRRMLPVRAGPGGVRAAAGDPGDETLLARFRN